VALAGLDCIGLRIPRAIGDLGVPPYLISATVIGVLAQRLARTLCAACKQLDADTCATWLVEVAKPWRLSATCACTKPVVAWSADIRAIAAASACTS